MFVGWALFGFSCVVGALTGGSSFAVAQPLDPDRTVVVYTVSSGFVPQGYDRSYAITVNHETAEIVVEDGRRRRLSRDVKQVPPELWSQILDQAAELPENDQKCQDYGYWMIEVKDGQGTGEETRLDCPEDVADVKKLFGPVEALFDMGVLLRRPQ